MLLPLETYDDDCCLVIQLVVVCKSAVRVVAFRSKIIGSVFLESL